MSTRPLRPLEVDQFLEAARRLAGSRRLVLRYLDSSPVPPDTLVVPLDPAENHELHFHKAARYALRRGDRDGLVTVATSDPGPFLALYRASAEQWETRYPAALIGELATAGAARFYEVRAGGVVIGASVALVGATHWMYWLASQNGEGRRRNSGYLALASILRDAREEGASLVNLGGSRAGDVDLTGVAYFKSRMGGQPRAMGERLAAGRLGRVEHRAHSVLRPLIGRGLRRLRR